ncbi:hypothetical protein KHO57_gp076 [Mycobacterium phage Phabba]|uniref:Uncharacterized protein n=1 Tax=Mycobacterium phage Phabba TaxID=2027899 RepID=A0A249XSE3_9CAUD|nr:hypothetical protein KHO57_gp076 [Mycobacterium phage Phabba]ASZ74651.1 hypothetical protein SEA_PHABBA_76 [Mycobacterium phage Phabba]
MSYIQEIPWEEADELLTVLEEAQGKGANTAITIGSFMEHLRTRAAEGKQAEAKHSKQLETLHRHVLEGMNRADYQAQLKKIPFEHIALDIAAYLLTVFDMEFKDLRGGPAFGEVVTDSDDYK